MIREKEEVEEALKRGLVPLEDFSEGTKCIWFSIHRDKKKQSPVVIGIPMGGKRVRINHIMGDGSIKEGGAVCKCELWIEKI